MRYQSPRYDILQVNTIAAERLCLLLREHVTLGPETVLLDICCGTGTLGLSMAPAVKRVIGSERAPPK